VNVVPTIADLKIMGIYGGAAVRARLLALLHTRGIACATEFRLGAHSPRSRGGFFRADAVVLATDRETPLLAIETKRYSGPLLGHRQRENYARCGIPAISVGPQTLSAVFQAIVAFVGGEDEQALAPFLVTDDAPTNGGKGAHVLESGDDPPEPAKTIVPTSRSDVSTTRTTWLTGYYEAYRVAYGEAPTDLSVKRMARTFKTLEIANPRPEVERRFRNYLASTPIRFYSVEHFADTFPGWKDAAPQSRLDPRPGESTDDYIARVGR